MRTRLQAEWNRPVLWPLAAGAVLLLLLLWGARLALRRREGLDARGKRAAPRPRTARPASAAAMPREASQAMADDAGGTR